MILCNWFFFLEPCGILTCFELDALAYVCGIEHVIFCDDLHHENWSLHAVLV
jgi:hypothetical protein